MNYYKRHIGDYAAKAGHLSPLEHGVYALLLDAYYNREEGPTQIEAVRWARARTPEEVAAVNAVLAEFFTESEGRFTQNRVEEELAQFRARQEVNRSLGAKGGVANAKRIAKRIATDSLPMQEANRVANEKPSHKPLAINHQEAFKALAPLADRFPDFWRCYPRKDSKAAALKAWGRLRLDAEADEIIRLLSDQLAAGMWREAQFTPHGSTYLNNRRWEDPVQFPVAPRVAPSKQLSGAAAFLGVDAHDLTRSSPPVVHEPDRRGLGEPVPAEPRRLSGE